MRAVAPLSTAAARRVWRRAAAVCFDVDSTVCQEEGIDVLADICGAGDAVAELTRNAMGGSMPFHDALEARLALMTPSLAQVNEACDAVSLSPRVDALVAALTERGTAVFLVSGGFRQMINPIAARLGIPESRVYANNILFDEAGDYAGFDANEMTARAGGKARVVAQLKATHGFSPMVMVGDGATDMEARDGTAEGADAFVGFGGVVVREEVEKGADWFVMDHAALIDELDVVE